MSGRAWSSARLRAGASDEAALGVHFDRVCALALEEDLGVGGSAADVTTAATVEEDLQAEASVVAKGAGVVCGLEGLSATYRLLDDRVRVEPSKREGENVGTAERIASISGPAAAVLTGERTALNLLGHLSGIATLARAFTEAAAGAQVVDTRKTLPGLRALQKYAVRTGGAGNHRLGLWDGVLVKDNHIAAVGGIGEAVRRAKSVTTMPVQVECSSAEEAEAALHAGADLLLLDNMEPEALERVVTRVRKASPDVLLEASGGITLENVAAVARTGVDRISVGALTHSAPALDVSLRLERTWREED